MMWNNKMYMLIVLALLFVATLGRGYLKDCSFCPKGHYVHDNGERCGKCNVCPPGTFNTLPGRATHCAKCRPRCHHDIQTKVKACAPDSDIYCKCPPGKNARTQEDMCYDVDDNGKGSASSTPKVLKENRKVTETTTVSTLLPETSKLHPTKGGKGSSGLFGERRNDVLVGVLTPVLIILVVAGVFIIYKCRTRQNSGSSIHVPKPFKVLCRQISHEREEQSSVPSGAPPFRGDQRPQNCSQLLQNVILEIAQKLPIRSWKMFLRLLPGQKLGDREIEDIEQQQQQFGIQERIYQGLVRWVERNPDASPQHLIDTLVKCKQNAMAEEITKTFSLNSPGRGDGNSAGNDAAAGGENVRETDEMHPLLDIPSVADSSPTSNNGHPTLQTPAMDIKNYPIPDSGSGYNVSDVLSTPGLSSTDEPNPFQEITKTPIPAVQDGGTKNPDFIGELYKYGSTHIQEQYGRLDDNGSETIPKSVC